MSTKEQLLQGPMRVDDEVSSLRCSTIKNGDGVSINSYGARQDSPRLQFYKIDADGIGSKTLFEDSREPFDAFHRMKSNLSERTLHKIECATKLSLTINVLLFIIKIAVFIETGSFAVIAALTDSFCDLVSQLILYCTQRAVKKQHIDFPSGRTRLENVGILVMAILMMILSCSVVFASCFTLFDIYVRHTPFAVEYSFWSLSLLITSIVLKFVLWLYCRQFTSSPSAMALAEDHRNDVLSNTMALGAVIVASTLHEAVWVDPAGGAVISIYIIWSWYHIALEETNKLIGIRGDAESMEMIHEMIAKKVSPKHHVNVPHDYQLSAYYIGRNLLVELRLIFAEFSELRKVCDSVMNIQRRLETLDCVERAFVFADHKRRREPIHKIPMLF